MTIRNPDRGEGGEVNERLGERKGRLRKERSSQRATRGRRANRKWRGLGRLLALVDTPTSKTPSLARRFVATAAGRTLPCFCCPTAVPKRTTSLLAARELHEGTEATRLPSPAPSNWPQGNSKLRTQQQRVLQAGHSQRVGWRGCSFSQGALSSKAQETLCIGLSWSANTRGPLD